MGKTPKRPFGSGRFARLAIGMGLAFALAAGQTPAIAFGDTATSYVESSASAPSDRIQNLLAQGDYIEHEAIALVRSDIAASRSNAMSLLSSAETLMDVSPEAVSEVARKAGAPAEMQIAAAGISPLSMEGGAAGTSAPVAAIVHVRDESKSSQQLLEELLATEGVLAAEPNYLVETTDEENEGDAKVADEDDGSDAGAADSRLQSSLNSENESAATAPLLDAPTDNMLVPVANVPGGGSVGDGTSFQWGNSNDGRMAGAASAGEDINYDDWNQGAGIEADGPVIAVLDTGIDGTNPDLANKLWSSSAYPELADFPGADEHGFSSKEENSTTVLADESGHGTHVAGIIAAEWNGTGTSGVSKNARLMSLKHNDTSLGILFCFAYAAAAQEAGVEIAAINVSAAIGGGSSTIMDTAITEVGLGTNKDQKGAITVFATGNAHTDVDDSAYSGSLLSENPYVVLVNSIDAHGGISLYSNYGKKTTDLAAPGSASLSTYPTSQMVYNGELDTAPALYESFDANSDQGTGVKLEFLSAPNTPAETSTDRSFDGDTSVVLKNTGETNEQGEPVTQTLASKPVDISAAHAAGKADYLSIRYATEFANDKDRSASITVTVPAKDGKAVPLSVQTDSFMALDGSWGGAAYKLPDTVENEDGTRSEIDYENFSIAIMGTCLDFDTTAGQRIRTPVVGDLLIDSIGIGSTLSPYKYEQGTSMAAPEVTGGAAVIAENSTSRGIELAARVRAAVSVGGNLEDGTCLSNGILDVQKGLDNPGPAITEVDLSEDGQAIYIWGYWFHDTENLEVLVGGTQAANVSQQAGEGGQSVITADLPNDFTGGQTEVVVHNKDTGDYARAFPVLGHSTTTVYYEKNLALPHEVSEWEKAQLVGFNGDIYAMPQLSAFRSGWNYSSYERYSVDDDAWTTVALPKKVIESVNPSNAGAAMVSSMSATPWNGKLAILVGCESEALWTIDQNGVWECLWAPTGPQTSIMSYGTLASDGTSLFVFGGFDGESFTASAYRYNDQNGWESLGALAHNALSPSVSYNNGVFLISGGYNMKDQGALKSGVECVEFDGGGNLQSSELDLSKFYTESGAQPVATGALKDGFMLVGPASDDGKADTYVLDDARTGATIAFGKRASDLTLVAPSAVAYKGSFYVLSKLQGATENDGYSFVATSVETSEVAGDAADTKGLRYWYEQARAIDTSKYTEASVKPFNQAYLQAQTLLEANPPIDEQTAVDNAAADLKLAIEGLEEKDSTQSESPIGLDPPDKSEGVLAKTGDAAALPFAIAVAGFGAAVVAGAAAIALRRRTNR